MTAGEVLVGDLMVGVQMEKNNDNTDGGVHMKDFDLGIEGNSNVPVLKENLLLNVWVN